MDKVQPTSYFQTTGFRICCNYMKAKGLHPLSAIIPTIIVGIANVTVLQGRVQRGA